MYIMFLSDFCAVIRVNVQIFSGLVRIGVIVLNTGKSREGVAENCDIFVVDIEYKILKSFKNRFY